MASKERGGKSKSSKKKKKPKKTLTPEQRKARKQKADHIRIVRTMFRNAGFDRVVEVAELQVHFGGQDGEFDDAFVYQNVIFLVEYTTSQSSDVTAHLKNKKIIFSKVESDPDGFISYLRNKVPDFDARLGNEFHPKKLILKIVYCSRFDVNQAVKGTVDEPVYLDYPVLKYFEKICGAIKMSALPEIFDFTGIDPSKVARKGIFPKIDSDDKFHGSILPDSASGFPSNYKVVSFYADAATLLDRAYVLRRDGWRSSFQAYQRMLQPSKIEQIRRKLKSDGQVFVNNIIATLPSDVHPVDEKGHTVDIKSLEETAPVKIALPLRQNSIGLIDGQHRLFSYYESREDDKQIAKLRNEQNLLVTGIIYPQNTSKQIAERFEATLFLAINSNQTNAPPALKQEIEVILKPFSPTAIGKQVMQSLAATGPLQGHVEAYFFDKGKLKTTSIVSYGLGPLIKLGGVDSLFKLFSHSDKDKIASDEAQSALTAYIKFSATQIEIFLNAVKANMPAHRWTTDGKTKDRVLTVTYINSFLITMRRIIEDGGAIEFSQLKEKLSGIDSFEFAAFHSSQYGRMADAIYEKHFKGKKVS
ncbi:DGQHR domain-containing protein [Mesorhizobium sp. B4-1-1]|uniref:DGQHR domain-containing protein n=1 Tax=Mesorhizobium sp. B4-1-1 TaxID=2589890 RepID=UPI0015E28739|nr:DGQHR domain-containing protein [Mesorhizobium sp. B4-1-1]